MLLAATIALTLGQTCTFDARWRMPVEFAVPLSDGTPWAKLVSSDVDPRGPLAHVVLDAEGHATVHVRANGMEIAFTATDFPVTAKTPLVFADVLTTSAATPLRVLRVHDESVDVVPAPRKDLEPTEAWNVRSVHCDALALGTLTAARETPIARPVPVRATARGAPRVVLERLATLQIATRGRIGHVEARLADGTRIDGWAEWPSETTIIGGISGGTTCRNGVASVERSGSRRCKQALRLSATKDGRTEEVGTLHARMGFFSGRTENGRVVIEPEQPWLTLIDGWSLTVAEADLRMCGDLPDSTTFKPPPAHLDR